MNRHRVIPFVVLFACVAACVVAKFYLIGSTKFDSICEAKPRIESIGYYCVIVPGNPQKLVVSQTPITDYDAKVYTLTINGISRVKGKAVMLNLSSSGWHNEPNRFFGDVEAIGDSDILDSIR